MVSVVDGRHRQSKVPWIIHMATANRKQHSPRAHWFRNHLSCLINDKFSVCIVKTLPSMSLKEMNDDGSRSNCILITLFGYWMSTPWYALSIFMKQMITLTGLRYCIYAGDEKAIITTAPSTLTDITQNHKGYFSCLTSSSLETLTCTSWYIWPSTANYRFT